MDDDPRGSHSHHQGPHGKLDPLCVRDFCDFCGYTESEFWKIMDKFYNRDLFEKNDCGEWVLKHPIWEENK